MFERSESEILEWSELESDILSPTPQPWLTLECPMESKLLRLVWLRVSFHLLVSRENPSVTSRHS